MAQTIVSDTLNAAAAANTGRQRAASQSRIGNSKAIGTTVSHGSGGNETIMIVIPANATSAMTPSMISLRGGGSRRDSARPITSGATVTMPKTSDANQCSQVVQIGSTGSHLTSSASSLLRHW